eukprot:s3185_g1.t1
MWICDLGASAAPCRVRPLRPREAAAGALLAQVRNDATNEVVFMNLALEIYLRDGDHAGTHLELVDHLLAVLRAMEPTFEFEASVQAQVWALASGVKATAPRVAVEMKKHLARLQELRNSTHKVMELFERKRSAMVEKNHYTLKVETLRREFQEREDQRKGNSKDQLHRLSRNQEKLAYAESEYMDTDKVVTKKIEEQLRQNRSLLFSSLEGLAQSACCGWLVSTGAVT